ncbi:unnamed protein product [Oikopleura dioica]|uniref:DNA 3'-5' helicase n=1 Tax=Oikopleura dioica TaxID=34765 RepID=E4XS55_OIKDI|nr:unnamed protein product [Oikopleura dioica]
MESRSMARSAKRDKIQLHDDAIDDEEYNLGDDTELTNETYVDEPVDLPDEYIDEEIQAAMSRTTLVDNNESFTESALPDFLIDSPYDDYVDVDHDSFDVFAQYVLRKKFGKQNFRGLQLHVIKKILRGDDIIGVFATGFGKSICYQILPFLVRSPAATLVISPLVALIEDQQRELTDYCIPSAKLAAKIKYVQFDHMIRKTKVFFLTPESVKSQAYRLEQIVKHVRIVAIVVDECHCAPQWGFGFRPSFQDIVGLREAFEPLKATPMLAITATASFETQRLISSMLGMKRPYVINGPLDRPNIKLVTELRSDDLWDDIKHLFHLETHVFTRQKKWVPNMPTIIYTTLARDARDYYERFLAMMMPGRIGIYIGSSDKSKEMEKLRAEAFHGFGEDQISLVIATYSFGMGLNKPNIRNVIIADTPENVSTYAQMIGRAGRDGQQATAYCFFQPSDLHKKQLKKVSMLTKDSILELYRGNYAVLNILQSRFCLRSLLLHHFREHLTSSICQTSTCCINCEEESINADADPGYEFYRHTMHNAYHEYKMVLKTLKHGDTIADFFKKQWGRNGAFADSLYDKEYISSLLTTAVQNGWLDFQIVKGKKRIVNNIEKMTSKTILKTTDLGRIIDEFCEKYGFAGDIDDVPINRNFAYVENFPNIVKLKDEFGRPLLDARQEYFWRLHKNNTPLVNVIRALKGQPREMISLATTCIERGYSVDLRQFDCKMSDVQVLFEYADMRIAAHGEVNEYQMMSQLPTYAGMGRIKMMYSALIRVMMGTAKSTEHNLSMCKRFNILEEMA